VATVDEARNVRIMCPRFRDCKGGSIVAVDRIEAADRLARRSMRSSAVQKLWFTRCTVRLQKIRESISCSNLQPNLAVLSSRLVPASKGFVIEGPNM
jgi:hypothetical protein